MAKLTKQDLLKRGNYDTFVKKFLSIDNLENKFLTKDGLFSPFALVLEVDGNQYAFEHDEKRDYELIVKRMEQAASARGSSSKIQLTGRYDNTNQIKTISLTDLEKTGEFGGQGAGSGKKENLGLVFEREFYESLIHILDPSNKKGKYDKQAREIVEKLGKENRSPLSDVIAVGELNQRRPLNISSGGLSLGSGEENIGSTVTDITLKFGDKEVFLSLKFQSTLAFANIGIGTVFTEQTMKKYSLNDNAMKVLNVFGLDYISFCETFNKYPHSEKIPNFKVDVTNKVKKSALKKLLRQMMGYGYVMVHGKGANRVDIYDVDESYLNKSTSISGPIVAYYGGTTGTGKKVIVNCESQLYKFSFNFRNKGGKLYPSHIMCDYKKK